MYSFLITTANANLVYGNTLFIDDALWCEQQKKKT